MPENTGHPTQKPEKLLAKIILASSNKGDIVFDPFAGAGSSLVTAKKLNRHYVGIEQSRLYTAWGAYRLLKATNDKSIQGYTDGVFWERNTLAAQQAIARKKNAKAKKVDSDKAKSTNAKDGLNDEQNSKGRLQEITWTNLVTQITQKDLNRWSGIQIPVNLNQFIIGNLINRLTFGNEAA